MLEYETVEVVAPIESLKFDERDGEYFALINSGLPSGCSSFHESSVSIEGALISITITNLQPAPGQLVACTAIYGIKSHRISLGNSLREGVTYKVVVNGSTTGTFTASARGSSPTDRSPDLSRTNGSDADYAVGSGQTVDVEYDKPGDYEVALRLGPLPPKTVAVKVKAGAPTQ